MFRKDLAVRHRRNSTFGDRSRQSAGLPVCVGPRIEQKITFQRLKVAAVDRAAVAAPARPSLLGDGLAQRHQRDATRPFATVHGIAAMKSQEHLSIAVLGSGSLLT